MNEDNILRILRARKVRARKHPVFDDAYPVERLTIRIGASVADPAARERLFAVAMKINPSYQLDPNCKAHMRETIDAFAALTSFQFKIADEDEG